MGKWKKTTCHMCATSCGLEMEVENNQIVNVRPDPDSPKSHNYCCRKGRAAKYYQNNSERLDYPMKKVGGEFVRISWDQAYKEIAEKASQTLKTYGARSFAAIGSALAAANSEAFITIPMLNALGSQNYFNPVGIEFMGLWWSNGKLYGDQANPMKPQEKDLDVLILWGSNSYVTHQANRAREEIREISESPERKLVVIDPRLSESARMADLHLPIKPGTDALFQKALIAFILNENWQDQAFVDKWCRDFDKILPWFKDMDIEGACQVCGIGIDQMRAFAQLITTKRWAVHQDLGLFCGRHNTLNSYLLNILMSLTGVALDPKSNMVQDKILSIPTSDENDPKTWRTLVTEQFPVSSVFPAGSLIPEIMNEAPEHIRTMICTASNPICSFPNSGKMKEALERLDLLVAIDICETETTVLSDYVLPAKDGYEGYNHCLFQMGFPEIVCQLRRPMVEATGERKEGAEILLDIADAMGIIPDLPDELYHLAKRAVEEEDRVPYAMALFKFIESHKEYFDLILFIVGKTLGKAMDSVATSILWAQLMATDLYKKGSIQRAGHVPNDKHKDLHDNPQLYFLCLMDSLFQRALETPEGFVLAITQSEDRDAYMHDHILHEDKKLHLYCDEINQVIHKITPNLEREGLKLEDGYSFVLSAGRHGDAGHNGVMRNPETYKYRQPMALAMNPEDGKVMTLRDGDMVKVSTRVGALSLPVEFSYQTARGYVLIPHNVGFRLKGKGPINSVNLLTDDKDMDEITGNPFYRYVPCKIEKL